MNCPSYEYRTNIYAYTKHIYNNNHAPTKQYNLELDAHILCKQSKT